MAKERNPARRQAVNESVHALGVRGRKTGLELPDTGIRDEHGMEPLDNIFSSPELSVAQGAEPWNETIDEEVDMEIDSPNAGPSPGNFLKNKNPKTRLAPPTGRPLPRKSFDSPPIRHRGLMLSSPRAGVGSRPPSSPPMGSKGVKRKLTFSARTKLAPPKSNGYHSNTVEEEGEEGEEDDEEEEDEEEGGESADTEEEEEDGLDVVGRQRGESGLQMGNGDYDQEPDDETDQDDAPGQFQDDEETEEEMEQEEDEEVVEREPTPERKRKVGNMAKKFKRSNPEPEPEPEPESELEPEPEPEPERPKARGRPKGKRPAEEPTDKRAAKRRRSHGISLDEQQPDPRSEVEPESEPEPTPKRPKAEKPEKTQKARGRGRPPSSGGGTAAALSRPAKVTKKLTGRPRKSDEGDQSVLIQQVPPLPKRAGLAIMRGVEEKLDKTTRSGRHSFKPVEYWRGEKVVGQRETVRDSNTKHQFVVQNATTVLRVDATPPRRTKKYSKGKAGTARKRKMREASYDEEDIPREPWEEDEGTVSGEVVVWEREHEKKPPAANEPVGMEVEQLALSSSATMTREIRDATFRFTKTLNTPYFGAGVVDLPPGAEKRLKNSRKMHMAFFVHLGLVNVTIGETSFSIGAGGQWFVPRGNFYSIKNEIDRDARIFFSQGCEIMVAEPEE